MHGPEVIHPQPTGSSTATTTVGLNRTPTLRRKLIAPLHLTGKPQLNTLPCHLTLLHDPPQPSLDIIAIYDLNADPFTSWINPDADHPSMWLHDFLPGNFPSARVMIWDFCISILNTFNIRAQTLAEDLLREASELLGHSERPLIFIGHSIGGLIIKQALILASDESHPHHYIFDAVVKGGLTFMGTPHRAGNWVPPAEIVKNMLKASNIGIQSLLLCSLKTDLLALFGQNSRFVDIINAAGIRVRSLHEEVLTDLGWGLLKRQRALIVDETSATVGCNGEDVLQISGDHRSMCKFSSRSEPGYNTLVGCIRSMIEQDSGSNLVADDLAYCPVPMHLSPTAKGVQERRTTQIPRRCCGGGIPQLIREDTLEERSLSDWSPCNSPESPRGSPESREVYLADLETLVPETSVRVPRTPSPVLDPTPPASPASPAPPALPIFAEFRGISNGSGIIGVNNSVTRGRTPRNARPPRPPVPRRHGKIVFTNTHNGSGIVGVGNMIVR